KGRKPSRCFRLDGIFSRAGRAVGKAALAGRKALPTWAFPSREGSLSAYRRIRRRGRRGCGKEIKKTLNISITHCSHKTTPLSPINLACKSAQQQIRESANQQISN